MSLKLFSGKSEDLESSDRLVGVARADKRTKNLVKRLEVGDVAIINHEDIDAVAADSLIKAKPIAVVNAVKSITGRYPNLGPQRLIAAGIRILDDAGSTVMEIRDGKQVSLDEDGSIYLDGKIMGQGNWLDADLVEQQMQDANEGMSRQIKAFAVNTMEYIDKEAELIFDGLGVPTLNTQVENRHVLVVVRGPDFEEDIKILKPYIKEYRPVVFAVDGAADALLKAGIKPDVIVGDMDSVSDKAIKTSPEVVVHAYRNGQAPGLARVEELGVKHTIFPFTGTSEDAAIILADEMHAALIVAVGTHTSLNEFLDKGRNGMASTFLTRLRVGSKIVDAKGVSRLYKARISTWQLIALVIASLAALISALATTATGQTLLGIVGVWWDSLWFKLFHLF